MGIVDFSSLCVLSLTLSIAAIALPFFTDTGSNKLAAQIKLLKDKLSPGLPSKGRTRHLYSNLENTKLLIINEYENYFRIPVLITRHRFWYDGTLFCSCVYISLLLILTMMIKYTISGGELFGGTIDTLLLQHVVLSLPIGYLLSLAAVTGQSSYYQQYETRHGKVDRPRKFWSVGFSVSVFVLVSVIMHKTELDSKISHLVFFLDHNFMAVVCLCISLVIWIQSSRFQYKQNSRVFDLSYSAHLHLKYDVLTKDILSNQSRF